MLVGKLDHRLTIIKETFIAPVPPEIEGTWQETPLITVWAAKIAKREDEAFDPTSRQRYAFTQTTFRTRWIPSFTPNDWLATEGARWSCECEGVTYKITGVRELGRRSGLEIQAEVKK